MRFDPIAPFRILVLGFVLAGIATAPASAQSSSAQSSSAQPSPAQSSFAQTKLEAFVTAALAVKKLVRKMTPQIRRAGRGEQAIKLREEANAEFIATIERTDDITVAEYKDIAAAAVKDQALMSQLRQMFATRTEPVADPQ